MEEEKKYLDEFEALLEQILTKEGVWELPEAMIKIPETLEESETKK